METKLLSLEDSIPFDNEIIEFVEERFSDESFMGNKVAIMGPFNKMYRVICVKNIDEFYDLDEFLRDELGLVNLLDGRAPAGGYHAIYDLSSDNQDDDDDWI
ncbi:hypothetical protein [Aliivibrio fischeri]|uniref:hypothetical protein n=1 Tax=Aliivibrio fischeri TaxID=668 RepID=UPI0007C51E24|nr:hypothetical protein [Aliivibrio fischeri]MBP3140117.1 hypothetical protein [Aliivibrio fischeri]MCE7556364.1 hypothetical protein [Aliivibrio fischeri]MCE7563073.1 hypothetical protein [Aliivibrio fischeri]MCE7571365.1 hypothetical protein [Aliivibrio fischeri]TGA68286.1 hypothetical protein VFES401_15520 [Aliivibrio fischeri]